MLIHFTAFPILLDLGRLQGPAGKPHQTRISFYVIARDITSCQRLYIEAAGNLFFLLIIDRGS